MKENKYLGLSIAVSIAAILWAIFATVVCVKLDRDNQKLIGMVIHCQERCKRLLEEKKQDLGANSIFIGDALIISGEVEIRSARLYRQGKWRTIPIWYFNPDYTTK